MTGTLSVRFRQGTPIRLSEGILFATYATLRTDERGAPIAQFDEETTFDAGIRVDGLTVMMFLLVTFVSLMVHIYSTEYMHDDKRYTIFFAMLSLFTGSMLFMLIANNLMQLFVGWELVGVCSYFLIGHYWEEKENSSAAIKAFITTRIGDVGFLFGIFDLVRDRDTYEPMAPYNGTSDEMAALGKFFHEAVTVDPVNARLYLTEDRPDGRFYRFVPTTYGDLSSGQLQAAKVDGTNVTWVNVASTECSSTVCQ